MKHKINRQNYGKVRAIAFEIAKANKCSIDAILANRNADYNVFLRVLLTKVAMENGVNPYQVSLFLRKHHSTVLHYEKLYLVIRKLAKFKKLEENYYEAQRK